MKERGLRMKLRIMTYNIHSGRDAWGRLDLAAIGEFIRMLNPDILALNEVRMGTSDVNGDEHAYVYEKGKRLPLTTRLFDVERESEKEYLKAFSKAAFDCYEAL